MSIYKPKNSPYWHYDFKIQGRRFCGSTGQLSKKEARKTEAQKRKELSEGPKADAVTLDTAASLYLDNAKATQASHNTTRYQLANLCDNLKGTSLLSEVRQQDFVGHVAKRRATVSNASVNREIQLARRLWKYASKKLNAKVSSIEWSDLMLKEPRERIRELTSEEEERLYVALRPDLHDFVTFALVTGARRSAVINLRWSDIDKRAGIAKIIRKGGGTQSLPLTPALMALIDRQLVVGPFVFTYVCQKSRGKRIRGERYPMTQNGWNKAWRAARAAAELEDFRFHDLRHTAATRLLRATKNLKVVQALLGHTDIGTTARYAHVQDEDVRDGLLAVESRNSTGTRSHPNSKKWSTS